MFLDTLVSLVSTLIFHSVVWSVGCSFELAYLRGLPACLFCLGLNGCVPIHVNVWSYVFGHHHRYFATDQFTLGKGMYRAARVAKSCPCELIAKKAYRVHQKKCIIAICILLLFEKSDFTFSHVFQIQNSKPVSSGHSNNAHSKF